jgi:aspartyl-tRNA(Asn)/glutamyl-tRNA(Gln) amidotransferase subunit A
VKLFPDDHETIAGTARRLRQGEVTCEDVLQSCLDRIEQREHEVLAWVLVDRTGALAQAQERDTELQAGRDRGPLHGIPIGVKDIIDVKGLPTTCGIAGWEGNSDPIDAAIVARLRAAGAIILGKTVTTPFAWIDPPVTRNPWNLERTPGGSSSGSAAAVACGMCLAALGTQTGGSITRPAAFCGVAGMKPTYGYIDNQGIFPLAPTLDHPGFIARAVADLRLIFEVCRRPDLPAEQDGPWVRGAVDRPRLCRPLGLFDNLASPAMATAMSSALECLGDAGVEVQDSDDTRVLEIHILEPLLRDHRVILASEAAATHRALNYANPPAYPARIDELLREGDDVRAVDYLRACKQRKQYRVAMDEMLRWADARVTPAALGAAPDPSTTGDPVFNSPWSLLGLPTVSFPIGLSADGLPLAVQLIGRTGFDLHLLRTAEWCETVIRSANRGS